MVWRVPGQICRTDILTGIIRRSKPPCRQQTEPSTRTRYTEYSRLILALTAIGRDPQNVGGYDLLLPLADLEKTTAQGVNGAAFALLALDCGGYELPQNSAAAVQATRDGYVDAILTRQNADGGWSLGGGASDPDLTAMPAGACPATAAARTCPRQ